MDKHTRAAKGKTASAKGFANESRLLAALLERNFNASRVDLPHSTYDLVLELDATNIIRLQVKTVGPNERVSFTGGTRGGVDREYKSDVKKYIQSTKTSDVVVGVQSIQDNGDSRIDFFFIPTLYIEKLDQGSISIRKILAARNNWELLKKCKDEEYVMEVLRGAKGSKREPDMLEFVSQLHETRSTNGRES